MKAYGNKSNRGITNSKHEMRCIPLLVCDAAPQSKEIRVATERTAFMEVSWFVRSKI